MAAGRDHTVLLLDNGSAVAFGDNRQGQLRVPSLPAGTRYIAAAAGGEHTVLVRDDGVAVAFGGRSCGRCEVPPLPEGTRYVAAAAGFVFTVLVRDDGAAVAFGRMKGFNAEDAPAVLVPDAGTRYVAAAAACNGWHAVLLRDDGEAVFVGSEETSRTALVVPPRPAGTRYIAAAASTNDTVFLRDDGVAVDARGNILTPPTGTHYIAVAVGDHHTVFLCDNGEVRASGQNNGHREARIWEYFGTRLAGGQCDVPALPAGMRYVAVSAGSSHTVLLRDDGEALAFGENSSGQCNLTTAFGWLVGFKNRYIRSQ